jgi:hypothetical protein
MTIDRVRSAACYVSLFLAVLVARAAHAESTKVTYVSPTSECKYDFRFDPKKDDAQRVSNTLDVAFGTKFVLQLLGVPSSPNDPARWPQFRDDVSNFCARTIKRVTELATLDLPAVEEYRAASLERLRDECDLNTAQARAALGEPSALRNYTKSAPKCSRFIEALEGTDTKTVWHDVIDASCQKNGAPDACRARHLDAETKPNAADWIKLDLLTFGWQNCSVPFLSANSDHKRFEALRAASEKAIRARLKVRAHPCDVL